MYVKSEGDDLLIVFVYVDEIIFGCTNDSWINVNIVEIFYTHRKCVK